ncbi:transporter substrate-binding domain-containing protein [Stutzerimonas azotifigens]|uniref:Transporter substrate-binding domain-containing protein n=1 Tax=Stutzerimonas azotifigens TaxID=291995 RepID=A0ABR5Z1W3_9GAMM|nr:transporter substrate-binding domain-containing protein [Stutzerimonas azotifigens]MBA1274184.1 transporter substrate-binding domain-containing protein [Stutzerimonas azotifigens]
MKSLISAGLLLASGAAFAAPSASLLDEAQQRGTLSVCTTGDYKPYTFLREDGDYEGIDIALAESLARSLGVEVQWVPTTWKTLMPDFLAGKCDMAVGGVSISLERQKRAFFSDPITVDGKIPFVRCDDVDKYQTIAQLNQPSVRLIEPPGGTNEAFVHRELPKAQLELYHDNTVIFRHVAENKADVMITDASEALYQQRNYPTLCAVNPDKPLQYSEKAFLLPRDDSAFKAYVDQWLHLSKATGEYQRIADTWLAKPAQ